MMQIDQDQVYTPGMAVIANLNKKLKALGTVISVQGDMAQVELQQPYRGADGNTHMSIWRQQMLVCKLSKT